MTTISLVGLLAGFCFAYCGIPAAWATVKAGKSIGTPVSIAWMICLGTVSMYTYLTVLHGFDPILTLNYSVEGLSWGTIVFYHYRPRRPRLVHEYSFNGTDWFQAQEGALVGYWKYARTTDTKTGVVQTMGRS